MCDFLLVVHCNDASILYRFRDIITYLPNLNRSYNPDHADLGVVCTPEAKT